MPRTPNEYAIHLLFEDGHREEIRFHNLQEFKRWYSNDFLPKHESKELINIPIKNIQGEYMVARPSSIMAMRVEPIFNSSVERF